MKRVFFIAATVVVAIAPVLSAQDCDRTRNRGSHTSISSHSDDDDYDVMSYSRSDGSHCESAAIVGRVVFTPNEDDIVSMPFGAHATFSERSSSVMRAMSFSRGSDGQLVRQYEVNGHSAQYDDEARRWLGEFLPRVLAQTGINVVPRVARWRAQGGVDNVLRNIEGIGGSGSMRAHYDALLNSQLSDDEMQRTLRSVSDNMRGSSGDLRAVLSRLATSTRVSHANLPSLENALNAIASSGDKTSVLQQFGTTGSPEVLASVMRVAESIQSSGDKSRLLVNLAPRYLTGDNRPLATAWFAVARDIPSSGDLRRVLQTAVSYVSGNPAIARDILAASNNIASSGDHSAVLISLVNTDAINTRELRDAFMRAAESIPSDGDRGRVLSAAISRVP